MVGRYGGKSGRGGEMGLADEIEEPSETGGVGGRATKKIGGVEKMTEFTEEVGGCHEGAMDLMDGLRGWRMRTCNDGRGLRRYWLGGVEEVGYAELLTVGRGGRKG